jgi:hypothetical protein
MQVRVWLLIEESGRWVAEDAALDEAGDANAASHLPSDTKDPRQVSSTLAAREDGQRR